MALTYSVTRQTIVGDLRYASGTVAFDSSYVANGMVVDISKFGFQNLDLVIFSPKAGFTFEYDYTNNKVLVKCPGMAIGSAGSASLDDFPLSGTGSTTVSVSLTSTATTPIRLGGQQEVAAAVDLSTALAAVTFVAFGK